MRSVVSKGGGNSSPAGKGKVWRSLNGHEDESRTQPRRTCSHLFAVPGGQGVRREAESEGHVGVSSEGWRISGRQSHQGNSQEPCSLDSQEEGN
jgi:hypothetical protein